MKVYALLMFALSAALCSGQRVPESDAEVLAPCSVIDTEPLTFTPYRFAKATLISLWYARNGVELQKATNQKIQKLDSPVATITVWMTGMKKASSQFQCAKKILRPFASKGEDDLMKTLADSLLTTYEIQIMFNDAEIKLLTSDSVSGETMDKLSTIQVQRDERWNDLYKLTFTALAMLVDRQRPDAAGKMTRLLVTKAQKRSMLNWIDESFPEFKSATSQGQWSTPANVVRFYFETFKGHKCADE